MDMPDEIVAWRGNSQLQHVGTWATTRYPEIGVAYVKKVRQRTQDVHRIVELEVALREATERIEDMVEGDDGEAFLEARKALPRLKQVLDAN